MPAKHIPDTISPEAREFLGATEPADLGRPGSAADWQALRDSFEAYDVADVLQDRYPFRRFDWAYSGVKTLVYEPAGGRTAPDDRIMLFLHGGAYVVGSPKNASALLIPVTHLTGIKVVAVQYRLAPEHPFPAALDDALAVYRALLEEYPPGAITVYGSSSGASLATAMVLRAREEGLALPAALGLLSPWSELAKAGDSYFSRAGLDPVLDYERTLEYAAGLYAGEYDWNEPLISPVHADYAGGFPRTLIQTGTRDLFLSNCARLHDRMRAGGVDASLTCAEGMWHSFQMMPDMPEAEAAIRELSDFLGEAVAGP